MAIWPTSTASSWLSSAMSDAKSFSSSASVVSSLLPRRVVPVVCLLVCLILLLLVGGLAIFRVVMVKLIRFGMAVLGQCEIVTGFFWFRPRPSRNLPVPSQRTEPKTAASRSTFHVPLDRASIFPRPCRLPDAITDRVRWVCLFVI